MQDGAQSLEIVLGVKKISIFPGSSNFKNSPLPWDCLNGIAHWTKMGGDGRKRGEKERSKENERNSYGNCN